MHLECGLVRMRFATMPGGLGLGYPERLWAKPLCGADQGRFEVQNSPFYALGVSYLDIVDVFEAADDSDELIYRRTIRRSGHSTYRLLSSKGSATFAKRWGYLERLGCTYDVSVNAEQRLYAVDVPANANFFGVYGIFASGQEAGVWTVEEGHPGNLVARLH